MKYIIYARKSSEEKTKQIQSVESQITEMKRIAARENLRVVKIFREEKSAKKPGRPIFGEMINFIKQGKAEAILCWKLDRLARNPADEGMVKWLLQQNIIKEIKTNDRDYKPDDNVLLSSVEFGMANQYILDLSKNVRRGQKAKLEKGGWPNMAPLGYKNENSTIVVDKERSKYIRKAFELYSTGGYSLKEIANILFQEGFRSRAGIKYHKSRIHKLLNNHFYYGVMNLYGMTKVGNHEPLISKVLFDKVQDVINGKNRSRYKKHFFPLRGFMTCHVCGCLLTAIKQKGFTYYYCTNGKEKCEEHKHYLKKEKAEKILASIFPKIQFDKEFIELCYEADLEKNKNNENFFENMKANLENRLKTLQEQELKLLDAQLSEKYTPEVIEAKLGTLNKESADLKQQLQKLQKQSPEMNIRTLEQTKKVFLSPYSLEKDFLAGDDMKKRQALEKLLLNAEIENQEMAYFKLKQPYQALQKVEDKTDFSQMRKREDSNLRCHC